MNEHKIYKISCISARKPDLGGLGPTYQNGNHCIIKSRGKEERNHESHIASYFLTEENNENASQQCTSMKQKPVWTCLGERENKLASLGYASSKLCPLNDLMTH